MNGQANRARRVLEPALDGLTDPEGGIGGEAESLAPVELLRGANQPHHALLDEVGEREALVLVAASVRRHEPKIRVDHQFLRLQVAALDALREVDLLLRGEQGIATRVREQLVDGLRDEVLLGRAGKLLLGRARRGLDGVKRGLGEQALRRPQARSQPCSGVSSMGVFRSWGLMGMPLIRFLESEL